MRVANGRQPGDTSGNEQLGPLHMLLFGALSGASAEAVVYPMEVIRRRMQMKAASAGVSSCPAVHRYHPLMFYGGHAVKAIPTTGGGIYCAMQHQLQSTGTLADVMKHVFADTLPQRPT